MVFVLRRYHISIILLHVGKQRVSGTLAGCCFRYTIGFLLDLIGRNIIPVRNNSWVMKENPERGFIGVWLHSETNTVMLCEVNPLPNIILCLSLVRVEIGPVYAIKPLNQTLAPSQSSSIRANLEVKDRYHIKITSRVHMPPSPPLRNSYYNTKPSPWVEFA